MEFLKKYLVIVMVAVGLLVALIFYSLNVPKNRQANIVERAVLIVFSPVIKPASQVGRFFRDVGDDYIDLVNVHEDNQNLKQQLKALNSRLVAANEAEQSVQRLSRLLDMKNSIKAPSVAASVIGEDVTAWFRTLIIDRGSSSGLREGMAVVAADGVVGQLIKVSQSTSRILLLNDNASGIAATIQRSRARGVVKGRSEGGCSLEFTTREEDVKVGDMVVSSGVGGVFMKGLPIGEVAMVKRGEYGIFQSVVVRPSVNLANLEEVLVILRGGYEQ